MLEEAITNDSDIFLPFFWGGGGGGRQFYGISLIVQTVSSPLCLHTITQQAWDRKYLKKEEDNFLIAREQIDRMLRERSDRAGGGCGGGGAGPPPTVGTFGISGIKKQLF